MTAQLVALGIDANDPRPSPGSGPVCWMERRDPTGGTSLVPPDDTGFRIRFQPSPERKSGPNWMHLDLTSSRSSIDSRRSMRSIALGGRHLDVGQLPEEAHVVLADPEGNEFCVIEPGNNFLADCGFLGELTCDGTRRSGSSGATHWAGPWCGTRTRRPPSGRPRRNQGHLGRSAGGNEDGEEPAALRPHRHRCRRRRGGPTGLPGCASPRSRPGRDRPDRAGRPRRQRVLLPDSGRGLTAAGRFSRRGARGPRRGPMHPSGGHQRRAPGQRGRWPPRRDQAPRSAAASG